MFNYRYLVVIQARLGSTRLPGKSLMTVGGIPMVRRVWLAAREAARVIGYTKVVVAWPERYSDLNENNVLERFRRLVKEFNPEFVIRLTADCPLLQPIDILEAEDKIGVNSIYYSNHKDGHDVQIIKSSLLFSDIHTDTEHVIKDPYLTEYKGLSVDTPGSLERVRRIVNAR